MRHLCSILFVSMYWVIVRSFKRIQAEWDILWDCLCFWGHYSCLYCPKCKYCSFRSICIRLGRPLQYLSNGVIYMPYGLKLNKRETYFWVWSRTCCPKPTPASSGLARAACPRCTKWLTIMFRCIGRHHEHFYMLEYLCDNIHSKF